MTDNNVNFVERFDAFSGFAGRNLPQFLSSRELRNFQIKLKNFVFQLLPACVGVRVCACVPVRVL